MKKAYMNWSGGKDSSLCLYKVLQSNEFKVERLLTSVNAVHDRISMHGVRRSLLEAQARVLGIPLETIELPEEPGMAAYESAMLSKVKALKDSGCSHSIFGDIFLEDLRNYRETKLKELEIICAFPLWKIDTWKLARDFIHLGFRSIVVCVNEQFLDRSFCGREIDHSFLQDLPAHVDPCGENGEFHSFVFEAPIFSENISIIKGELVYRKYQAPKNDNNCHTNAAASEYGFYFCDLLPGKEI
jgi:uncharacterized protein (TIGR00290 family)